MNFNTNAMFVKLYKKNFKSRFCLRNVRKFKVSAKVCTKCGIPQLVNLKLDMNFR